MEIKIDFKQNKLNTKTNTRSVVDTTVSFQSISVSDIDTVYRKNISASSLTLPINPNKNSVTYTFVRNGRQPTSPKVMEKITFTYSNETRIISAQCGAFVYFLNLEISDSSYGTSQYKILNDRLLKSTSNVQIFF
ncbi:MAG: DUF6452 family protein [Flammeovirgaceae bacterium]